MPYFSIMTTPARDSFAVAVSRKCDATWTKDVIEFAEFKTHAEAEAFLAAMKALLTLAGAVSRATG